MVRRTTLTVCWKPGLDALDTEELNKRFYRELFDWFTLAVGEARFPTTEARTLDPEEHIIRLITRLLFVWFIKEKGLVAVDLFIKERIEPLLKSYNQETGDSYYRTVLQNLFFATLNTEIGRRRFSEASPTTHRSFSLYRYQDEMSDPESLIRLFKKDTLHQRRPVRLPGQRGVHDKGRLPNRLLLRQPQPPRTAVDSQPALLRANGPDRHVQSVQIHRRGEHSHRTGSRPGPGTARQGLREPAGGLQSRNP